MADLHGFDASQVEPTVELEPVPAGTYLAAIIASEMKPTKSGTGSFLELQFQILEGPCKGRHLWTRLNLANPNEVAVQIARGQLSAICRAVGVLTPKDSQELHDLPLEISVKVKRREDNGELSNEIKGFAKKSAPQGPPSRSTQTPPWART